MADLLLGGSSSSDVDERIASKAALEAAEEQLQTLCASHAGTFVEVERRGRSLEAALEGLLSKVHGVETEVSKTQQALEQEEETSGERSLAALSEKHRVRRRTLLQHSSLLELLELPSLMDACVRSNLYEEALSIAAFANTLERRHTERNPVVMKVISQVRSRQSDLRRYLLHSLKHPVTMPECLEIVTALRRLNSIDLERQSASESSNLERVHAAMELSLQVDFLEARDAWLDQPLSSNSNLPGGAAAGGVGTAKKSTQLHPSSSSEQLLDTIERYRTRMFEIATQFNAIFRARSPSLSGGTGKGGQQASSISLLSMWATRRVNSFLRIVKMQLSNSINDSASLRDALDACVFFSGSMGRLGADFTSQLPPLFEQKMLTVVVHHWSEGMTQFAETLKICRDAGVATPLVSSAVPSDTNNDADSSSDTASSAAPPRQLMAIPPMGRLVNAFLTGLNELRRCLMPGIFSKLRSTLEESLLELKNILHTNERSVMTPGLRGEAVQLREAAKKMKGMAKNIVFPYLRGAVEMALGNEEGANQHLEKLHAFLKPPPPPTPPPAPAHVQPEVSETIASTEEGTTPAPEKIQNAPAVAPAASSTTAEIPQPSEEAVDESGGGWAEDDGIEGL
eukprot:CAMPEP_0113455352 /NCGR_PEP_ID=MMETSP0014_2-20120614/8332_1 /TAXON_ID=2857 /ORGANISM="Nitzschia sp." /LENGTH=625 /DNA_ID=CAMNT_0000346781 /DNA_START=56 /DNA_END=1933 /DNA_ORIENTATION=+ /assembly_acc=CAM_ASM_000159